MITGCAQLNAKGQITTCLNYLPERVQLTQLDLLSERNRQMLQFSDCLESSHWFTPTARGLSVICMLSCVCDNSQLQPCS